MIFKSTGTGITKVKKTMNNDENGDKFDAIRVEQASEYAHIIPLLSVFLCPIPAPVDKWTTKVKKL